MYKRQALYDQVKDTDLDQYLDGETKENFKTALEAAKEVLDDENALVKDVETAYNNLKASYEALEKKPIGEVDKTILEKVIAEANRLKGTEMCIRDRSRTVDNSRYHPLR